MQCFLLWYWMFDGVFEMENCVDLSQPKWDQSHYFGRARHFFSATNPMNLFVTPSSLENAKLLVESHKKVRNTQQVTYFPILSALVKTFQFVYRVRKLVPRLKSYGTPNT